MKLFLSSDWPNGHRAGADAAGGMTEENKEGTPNTNIRTLAIADRQRRNEYSYTGKESPAKRNTAGREGQNLLVRYIGQWQGGTAARKNAWQFTC